MWLFNLGIFLVLRIRIFVSLAVLPTHHGAIQGEMSKGKSIYLGESGLHNQYTHTGESNQLL